MHETTLKLAEALGAELLRLRLRCATAESCTGGGIAEAITSVPGSSRWFELGLVTYSNRMKTRLLDVDPGLLLKHGAVSEPVVRAMLASVLARAGADVGVAVSGIAGPDGATPGKPVGTVWLAWGGGQRLLTRQQFFAGDRAEVRRQAGDWALRTLLEFLIGEQGNTV